MSAPPYRGIPYPEDQGPYMGQPPPGGPRGQFAPGGAAGLARGGDPAYGMPMGPGPEGRGLPPGASPYYQRGQHASPYGRPPYQGGPPYGPPPGGGGGLSPSEMAAMQAQRAAYGYGAPQGSSPDQRGFYGMPPSGPPPNGDAYSSQFYGGRPDVYSQRLPGDPSVNLPPSHYHPKSSPASSGASPPKQSPNSRASPIGQPASFGYNGRSEIGEDDDDSQNERDSTYEEASGRGETDGDGADGENEDGQKWFSGSVPLGLEDDKYWLSELQVYLRSHFAEAFGATEEDIAAPMHGRNKPIALGQVGIRCMHCKHDNPAERGQQATSYPSLVSGIYNSVQQMLRLHLDCCLSMPLDVRQKIEQLKLSSSSRGGRKQYWIDSAKRLGLVDTPHGIHFGRDPLGPLPPLTGPSVNSKEGRKKKQEIEKASSGEPEPASPTEQPILAVDPTPLVYEEDKPLISDFLFLTLEQMSPCKLMEADRVGCYKTRKVGFPGLACRHCVGQAGCGRYFPASEASLSQTTTSQTIMNHVRNCRRCPVEIRENLEIMKRARMGPDGKRADKPKHGGRKIFFHRLWCRIQGLEIGEEKDITDTAPKKKQAKAAGKKKKKKEAGSDEEESSGDETEDEESSDEEGGKAKGKSKAGFSEYGKKKGEIPWYEGCASLSKAEDPHWLSEMECLARKDLVEAFSLEKDASSEGYGGKKEPAPGQVGIRCVFCKELPPADRPKGYMNFPDSLSTIHKGVGDLIRLHFPSCPSLPDDQKQAFKSKKGFDAKVVGDDAQPYWIDSARDIGLCNIPSDGPYAGWGLAFRREPSQPSPADKLDKELASEETTLAGKGALVRIDEDKGECPDEVMLLLRNVKACKFKKTDRRGGAGARGRDRVPGFPGLCCKFCGNSKNSSGRYFPVSAKNLTDSTANSLQSHVASCSKCPEPIKASLAYLNHRTSRQKTELGSNWKKAYFKKVWDRLHIERDWEEGDDGDDDAPPADAVVGEASAAAASGGGDDSATEDEELGEGMENLIKAAAMWLTEQDGGDGGSGGRKARGKGLPNTKRSPKNGDDDGSSPKKRRVDL